MKQSHLFTKTQKENPSDEISKNAQLLIRAGFINKEMAGVYDLLPLGLIVFNKIKEVIRKEMNAIGGQELILSTLQDPVIWKKTNRWNDDVVDIWFKTSLSAGGEIGLGWTHEEAITRIMTKFVHSYKDLPAYPYQFQNKFRNEIRAKSGIMRTREFVMKDMYSFSKDEKSHTEFYEKCAGAYMRIFNTLGIGDKTYKTFASGGAFTKYSHEFQTISDSGEDIIFVNEEKNIAVNEEVMEDSVLKELGVSKEEMLEKKSIEVGNIFSLGTKFSDELNLKYKDEEGNPKSVVMGSYGIGPGRLLGTIAEILSDDKGLVWPSIIAPFSLHLISIDKNAEADMLYEKLISMGIEVLYDDRDVSAGNKFADSDLIGIPIRIVLSDRSIKDGGLEVKNRTEKDSKIISEEELLKNISV